MFAGFTQIDFQDSPTNNSMLFLKPAATKHELITGLAAATSATPGATYVTLNNNGRPTTVKAGIAFPGNDWLLFPHGDEYLVNLPGGALPGALEGLRQKHLTAVNNLLNAIDGNNVSNYLNNQFTCP